MNTYFEGEKNTTNWKFERTDKYHEYNKTQKNSILHVLNNFKDNANNPFIFLQFFAIYSLVPSLYDNDFGKLSKKIDRPLEWSSKQCFLFRVLR